VGAWLVYDTLVVRGPGKGCCFSEGKERCCDAERSLVWSAEQILARERCGEKQLPDVK
jgi:hypothetical protein